MAKTNQYLYDNSAPSARARLSELERIEDADSFQLLEDVGIRIGQSCLELGAGAGSVASWLSEQVGSSGRVVATDLDPSFLDSSKYEVVQHNLEQDELPKGPFDLVHLRHLLIHLSDPPAALNKTMLVVKAGGHVVVEESDLRSWVVEDSGSHDLESAFTNGVEAVLNIYESRGMNICLGAEVSKLLETCGFQVTHTSERSRLLRGGSAEAVYQSVTVGQLAETVKEDEPAKHESLLALSTVLKDSELRYRSRTTVAAVGVRQPQ